MDLDVIEWIKYLISYNPARIEGSKEVAKEKHGHGVPSPV